eukprot:TRINITY_DN6747_c0_g1_i1.p1 TRINITY_DN6747_c0_g1~~TRINITY_DN6747_c0_g1_i1.p1  ORF type:complete len:651 (+),score=144.26 TRINITY_DN6747_c0_g1_i1:320-2272(+)
MLKRLMKKKGSSDSPPLGSSDGENGYDNSELLVGLDSEIMSKSLAGEDDEDNYRLKRADSCRMTTPVGLKLAQEIAQEAVVKRKRTISSSSMSINGDRPSPTRHLSSTNSEPDMLKGEKLGGPPSPKAAVSAEELPPRPERPDRPDKRVLTMVDDEDECELGESTSSVALRVPLNDKDILRKKFADSDTFIMFLASTSILKTTVGDAAMENCCSELFDAPEDPTCVRRSESGNEVVAASKFKLIALVTSEKHDNSVSLHPLVEPLFLGYRNLWTATQMAELLILRYNMKPPSDLVSFAKLGEWTTSVQQKVQRNVVEIIIFWFEKYYEKDVKPVPRVQMLIMHFMNLFVKSEPHLPEDQIPRLQCALSPNLSLRVFGLDEESTTPSSKRKKSKKAKGYTGSFNMLDMDPILVARQLTLIEAEMFQQIGPMEFAGQGWSKADKETTSPNILKMIRRFNHVCAWVAFEILGYQEVEKRALVLARFIIIGQEFLSLRNYNGVMTIVSALQQVPIYRLKKTWNILPGKLWDIWDRMYGLMDSACNFQAYRETLEKAQPPCIPYLGTILTDFTMTDDGNPKYYKDTKLYNVSKLVRESKIVSSIMRYRSKAYTHPRVPDLIHYFSTCSALPEDALIRLSKKREPRNQRDANPSPE